MKIFAFSDIHGEFNKLKALYNRLNIQADDLLIFLGDNIDRGPMSFEVIEFLIGLDTKHNCVFLLGNHEAMLMDYMTGIYESTFLFNGGRFTVESYEKNGYNIHSFISHTERKIPESHLKFFQSLKLYYETEDYIFVHAGIDPTKPMNTDDVFTYLWNRNFCLDDKNAYTGKPVVFGHTPSSYVMNEKHRICIDTGACFSSFGNLTCVVLPERTFVSQGATLEDLNDESH